MIDAHEIRKTLNRLSAVEAAMGDSSVMADPVRWRETVREHARLRKLEASASAYFALTKELEGNRTLLDDPDFAEEARAEAARIEAALPAAERAVLAGLLPADPTEGRNACFEIRAGTGGDEAALFAGDLFRMYARYCETCGWKIRVQGESRGTTGGYKEILFVAEGEGAYGRFRYESGGHRVQRVPVTEMQGRIHTSAATVVVFPEADEHEDLDLPEKDIRIDLFCAGGAGGQHVNKTESAVRMTHLPTGLTAVCQDERSQQRNREKCYATLKARVADALRRAEEAKHGADRLTLRGSGDRSGKIRTYNFPQNRLTDHRIDLTLHALDRVIDGELAPVLDALAERDLSERLSQALDVR